MSESELMADRLYEASTRATWYQTGEAKLLTAASVAIRGHDHDTAKAVAIEREATSAFLDAIAGDEMWADIATRYRGAAEAVRNGEHVKGEA